MCCTCNSARTVLRITSGFEPINNTKMKKMIMLCVACFPCPLMVLHKLLLRSIIHVCRPGKQAGVSFIM